MPLTRLRRPLFDSHSQYHGFSRVPRLVCGAVALALLHAASALAQDTGGTQIVVPQRTPWLEAIVVVVLCGAALFAVCRSSRRN